VGPDFVGIAGLRRGRPPDLAVPNFYTDECLIFLVPALSRPAVDDLFVEAHVYELAGGARIAAGDFTHDGRWTSRRSTRRASP